MLASSLKVGDRVRPLDPSSIGSGPGGVKVRTVGTIVEKTSGGDLPPYLVAFQSMYCGDVGVIRAYTASQITRMATPGDRIEVVEDRYGCGQPPGRLGTIETVHSFDNDTGDDVMYRVRPDRGEWFYLQVGDFRIVDERPVDVELRRPRRPFWNGIDSTYVLATFRHRRTGWKFSLEWKPADLWIGLYTQPKTHAVRFSKGGQRRHYWVAFLTLVVHFWRHYASE